MDVWWKCFLDSTACCQCKLGQLLTSFTPTRVPVSGRQAELLQQYKPAESSLQTNVAHQRLSNRRGMECVNTSASRRLANEWVVAEFRLLSARPVSIDVLSLRKFPINSVPFFSQVGSCLSIISWFVGLANIGILDEHDSSIQWRANSRSSSAEF